MKLKDKGALLREIKKEWKSKKERKKDRRQVGVNLLFSTPRRLHKWAAGVPVQSTHSQQGARSMSVVIITSWKHYIRRKSHQCQLHMTSGGAWNRC
jgi:hypothetical protein